MVKLIIVLVLLIEVLKVSVDELYLFTKTFVITSLNYWISTNGTMDLISTIPS